MPDSTIQWIITSGAVVFAFGTSLWAVYEGLRRRTISRGWGQARRAMEATIARADILFQSDPDLTLMWNEGKGAVLAGADTDQTTRYALQVPDHALGRGHVLDPDLQAADGGEDGESDGADTEEAEAALPDLADRFEGFIASLEDASRTRFAQAVDGLRTDGERFCIMLHKTDGGVIEAQGRPAGAQSVVKLRDVSPDRAEIDRLTTELAQAEADRAAFADMLDKAPFPIWRRRGHTLIWANQAYAQAVDAASPDEAVSRRLDIDSGDRSLAAIATRSGDVQIKRRYVVVNGARRAMDLMAIPSTDGTGGIALDMSAVDDAQQQLSRHLDAHKETLDKMRTGVAIFGADRKLVFYNDAYVKLWDMDRRWLEQAPEDGEILERLRERRRLPEQADFKDWKRRRLALYQELVDGDEMWHLPDGRTLRVVCRAHPFGGLIYLYEDVSDQIALESSYNTLSNVQRATLDHLHEGVAVFGSDGKLKLYNAALAQLWGLDPETLKGEPHFNGLTEACAPQLEDIHLSEDGEWTRIASIVTAVGASQDLEPGRLIRKDGTIVDFAAEALPDGRILLTFLDVTDSARIEKALRERNDALETADRLKSEFISNVSYQLRTPLNSIIGFGEMMESGMVGSLEERQQEYMGHILQASGQLRDLINDILDLAMIEAGTITLDLNTVDIHALLDNARQVAVSRAADMELTVSIDCPKDIGSVVADERRLRQILFNLTSNAMRFTQGDGTVTLGAARKAGGIELWVADTGQGIPPEYQASAFDSFSTRDTNRRGAGLGLSLVKSFVELHGGRVTLESEPDKGTRVICHLPDNPQIAGQAAE